MAQPVGSRLGPYEVEAPLGAGGMGEVYRARDTRLGRAVALKVLAARLSAAPGQRERFAREARAISSVEHPNICPLYDVGSSGDVDFIVMQYVEGETLADRLARGPLAPPQAVAIARQVAAGLEAAHAKGVVHRDLKPANIQLTRDGQVKLLDFGLARILDEGAPAPLDTATPTQAAPSLAGSVVGTAPYMSPEQARGEPVDARTDVWSFGCVLYEMLAGRRAFAGHSLPDVMAAVVAGEPDWARLPTDTPAQVRRLLRLCLRKERGERLRDIGDIRLQLDSDGWDGTEALPAHRMRESRIRVLLPWAVAAAALAVAALALVRSRGTADPLRPAMRFSAVTNIAGVEAQPSLSPDGRSVAYVSNHGGQWDVFVTLVSGGSPVRVTNDSNLELRPRWSPDGSRLAFGRLNERGLVDIWVTPALGGTARLLVTNARQPAWSPDGQKLAYSSNGTLWLSDASGANPRAVTRPESPVSHYQPAFSPDGGRLAFLRRRDGPRAELSIVDVATGAVRALTHDFALVTSPVWSPDGRSRQRAGDRARALVVGRRRARRPAARARVGHRGRARRSADTRERSAPRRPRRARLVARRRALRLRRGGGGGRRPGRPVDRTLEGQRRRLLAGWFNWCAWTGAGDLVAIAGRPDLRGELWRVSRDGRAERVLTDLPLTQRPQVEYVALSRFDVHPDGSRIVLEAYASFEADISLIENVP